MPSFDFKKMSFGQLIGIGGGVFIAMLVIAAIIISAMGSKKPPPVTKQPVQFAAPANELEMEQIHAQLKQLEDRLDANAQATKTAFTETARAIDQQNANIGTLNNNINATADRVTKLEQLRINTHVNVIKPADAEDRPTRAERLATPPKAQAATAPASEAGNASSGRARQQPAKTHAFSSNSDYKVVGTVGRRVWIREGDREFSVTEGEQLPVRKEQLIVQRVAPNGQVSVSVESRR